MSSINNNINDNPSKRTSSRAGSLANDEQANSFEARLKRLRTALGVSSDAELARKLGIKQQGVSGVRKKKQLPLTWLITV
ncbi:MAG: helix-turn-helix domain containing protein, partial [Desulfobacteraceae bacterium]|nr:helix-turn-helix domain containing protein [Desulfobacteraceae bacterium]